MSGEKKTVLVVDDTPENIDLLSAVLSPYFKVKAAMNGALAIKIAQGKNKPDIILLDVMMPNIDGLSVCKTLRQRGDATPILVVTARHLVSDRVAGLDAGADDYLVKPFALEELLARVRALLRRGTIGESDGLLEAAGIRLDQGARKVSRNGTAIELTKTEFDLLELLMHNVQCWDCFNKGDYLRSHMGLPV